MIESLSYEPTEDTPKVLLNGKDGTFEISGVSLMDEPAIFYSPVLKWLTQYGESPNNQTTLEIKLEYLNTGSARLFLDLFIHIKKLPKPKVIWHVKDDDEDMEEMGEELAALAEFPFEIKRTKKTKN